jgi:hypothetical protein
VWRAVDGGQGWRRRSGEARDRKEENGREMVVQEQKKRCIWSLQHALSYQREHRGRETKSGSTACTMATGIVRAEARGWRGARGGWQLG